MSERTVNTVALRRRRLELYPAPHSRKAFCAAAGVSESYVKYIEAGTHQPRPRTAEAIAAALKWDVELLYRPGGSETVADAARDAA